MRRPPDPEAPTLTGQSLDQALRFLFLTGRTFLHDFIEKKYASIYETLRTKKALDDKTEADLKKALEEFTAAFGTGKGDGDGPDGKK